MSDKKKETLEYLDSQRGLINYYAPTAEEQLRYLSSAGTALIICLYFLKNAAHFVRQDGKEDGELLSFHDIGESLETDFELYTAAIAAVKAEAPMIFRQLQLFLAK